MHPLHEFQSESILFVKQLILTQLILYRLTRMMMSRPMTEKSLAYHVRVLNRWRREELDGLRILNSRVIRLVLKWLIKCDPELFRSLKALVPFRAQKWPPEFQAYISKLVKDMGNNFGAAAHETFSNGEQLPPEFKTHLCGLVNYLNLITGATNQKLFSKRMQLLPEIKIYLHLLVLVYLIDQRNDLQAGQCSSASIALLNRYNRTNFGVLAHKLYFFYSFIHERSGDLASIRSELFKFYSLAISHKDELGQEVLLNLLLRNYLHYKMYAQAEKLKATMKKPRSRPQLCRCHFYVGKIQTIQQKYSDAKEHLLEAARVAPVAARGFQIECMKWAVIVQLLLGEIPEKTIFTQKGMKNALEPYFKLTKATRTGNLDKFREVAAEHDNTFKKDHTDMVVRRLRLSVIRTGLRNISISYSRISLTDIHDKLRLKNDQGVELIVAKAIRDGIIDAKLDHVNGWMVTMKNEDVYYTSEPQAAFHARTMFCLNLDNEAVRAQRFPRNNHRTEKDANSNKGYKLKRR